MYLLRLLLLLRTCRGLSKKPRQRWLLIWLLSRGCQKVQLKLVDFVAVGSGSDQTPPKKGRTLRLRLRLVPKPEVDGWTLLKIDPCGCAALLWPNRAVFAGAWDLMPKAAALYGYITNVAHTGWLRNGVLPGSKTRHVVRSFDRYIMSLL